MEGRVINPVIWIQNPQRIHVGSFIHQELSNHSKSTGKSKSVFNLFDVQQDVTINLVVVLAIEDFSMSSCSDEIRQ